MMKTSIGDRMKNNYEDRYRIKLTRRTPVVMRLDGKCFSTLTKNCNKPFDAKFSGAMVKTGMVLCKEIQGAKFSYVQSDEVSILITDYGTLQTDAWFDYNIQKMTSVAAAVASTSFSFMWGGNAVFDCRVFNVPKEEVCNYFIWRQQDWIRNSLSMFARTFFSHKELHKKNSNDMHEMLFEKGVNWANLEQKWKNGNIIRYTELGWARYPAPIFSVNREIIENYV